MKKKTAKKIILKNRWKWASNLYMYVYRNVNGLWMINTYNTNTPQYRTALVCIGVLNKGHIIY